MTVLSKPPQFLHSAFGGDFLGTPTPPADGKMPESTIITPTPQPAAAQTPAPQTPAQEDASKEKSTLKPAPIPKKGSFEIDEDDFKSIKDPMKDSPPKKAVEEDPPYPQEALETTAKQSPSKIVKEDSNKQVIS